MDHPVKPWPFMMRRDGISMIIKIKGDQEKKQVIKSEVIKKFFEE